MPRAGLTADRVVADAAALADAEGLDAVTPAALARRLGVRPASLYAHVDGAADLRQRLLALSLAESADAVAEAVAGRAGPDAVRALADAHRSWAHAHPGRYAATRIPAADDSPALAPGRRHAELSRAVLRGYDLDAVAEVHAVRLLGSVVHGFVTLELAGGFAHSRPDAEQSWDAAIDAVTVTLSSWAGASQQA